MNERRVRFGALCREFGAELLYSFGSRSREALSWLDEKIDRLHDAASDLDLGIKFKRGAIPTVEGKVRIAQALEDFFGARRADLVVLDEADPFVAAEIVRGEILFAEDRRTADEYELFSLRRVGDLLPYERERIDLLLKVSE